MITSDIKKLLFSPSCRLVQEPHTEAGLERRWGGTIVITIRRKKKTDENQVKDEFKKKNLFGLHSYHRIL